MGKTKSIVATVIFTLGFAGSAWSSVCNTADVMIGGASADLCGSGPTNDNIANTPGDYMGWDVNVNGDGGRSDWQYYFKQDLGNEDYPNGTTTADYSDGAGGINLQITSMGGNDNWGTGNFSLNAGDPLLIVLGDGAAYEYTWYLFTGLSGPQTGSWDTSGVFGGNDLSNITAYTVVPVPAAVWLFGSGLLGLVGVARRRRAQA
jgi:hypothetical protein